LRSKAPSLDHFFNPRSIAIVGASATKGKLGQAVLENLLAQGFDGKIYPVNPALDKVGTLKCYKNLDDLPEVPELSIILIPADSVPASIKEHAEKGIRNVIVVSAGFREIGSQGEELEVQVKKIAQENGIRLVGPNCLGIFDNVSKIDTFFNPRDLIQRPPIGRVSLASQSGSFVGHLLDLASSEHLGIARVITYGNRADVDESDALRYFADDYATKIAGLYLEGVTDGKKFLDAAGYCSSKKPLVVLKTGKFESMSKAVSSHTGTLAGSYSAYRAAFRKAKLIEVNTLSEFIDGCKALEYLPRAKGKRVLIVGHAGGLGLTLADLCLSLGLVLPQFDGRTTKILKLGTVSFASLANPIDLTASGTDDNAEYVLREGFVKRDIADIAIYLALWGLPQNSDKIGEILSRVLKQSGKPVIVAGLQSKKSLEKRGVFESQGLPVFPSLSRAAKVARLLFEARHSPAGDFPLTF
jgi:acetate---CoA ligase (ADP-forming) subunit alpha